MLNSIQYLRGIASLLVVASHFQVQQNRYGNQDYWIDLNFGAMGVDLFFIISGFIICLITLKRATSPISFLRDRIIRVVPLYWVFTAIMIFFALTLPNLLKTAQFDLMHVLASLFFVPRYHPVLVHEIYPILIQGWTLNYEMFFYLLFSISLAIPKNISIKVVIFTLALLSLIGLLSDFNNEILYTITSLHLLEFLCGIVLGVLYSKNRIPSINTCAVLLVFGILIFLLGRSDTIEMTRVLAFGIPSLFLVMFGLAHEKRGSVVKCKTLKILGDSSYSLYLSHTFVLSAIGFIWSKSNLASTFYIDLLILLASIIACVVVGLLSYYILEIPITRFLKKRYG